MHFVDLFKIQIWSGLANLLSLILSVQLPFYCLMGNIESVALSLKKLKASTTVATWWIYSYSKLQDNICKTCGTTKWLSSTLCHRKKNKLIKKLRIKSTRWLQIFFKRSGSTMAYWCTCWKQWNQVLLSAVYWVPHRYFLCF